MPPSDHLYLKKLSLLVVAFVFLGCTGEKPDKKAAPTTLGPAVTLPAVQPAFAELPPYQSKNIVPMLKERTFPVDRAVNYKQVAAFLGIQLTPGQKKFLADHKFLLIPKSATKFRGKVDLSGMDEDPFDEMIGLFDVMSGASDPMQRQPENCRLVNPDVMLQALHKYFENSLEYLEKTELAKEGRDFLSAMQARAFDDKTKASGPLAEHYETIVAQFTVPLVILENATWPNPKAESTIEATPTAPPADDGDTLEHALELLNKYKDKFSGPVFDRIVAELQLIYGGKEVVPSPLYGQYAKEGAVKADYTQFTPRSHYVKNSLLRGYFRAMIYLGRNSYLLGAKDGISDAMLVAYLMATPGPNGQAPLQEWQRIMELTGFYAGQPDDIGYPQWRDYLVKVLGSTKLSPGRPWTPRRWPRFPRGWQGSSHPGFSPKWWLSLGYSPPPKSKCWGR